MPTNYKQLLPLKYSKFDAIIFDLGGVIINLDVNSSFEAFSKLGAKGVDEIKELANHPAFHDFERGHITEKGFRTAVSEMIDGKPSDVDFDAAWNKMILDAPVPRLKLLDKLRKTHRIFLLSNTNETHLRFVRQLNLDTQHMNHLDDYFEKAYYSNEIGMRKPDAEIFEFVVKQNNLDVKKTLFIDDMPSNLAGAESIGISGLQVTNEYTILDFFNGTK